MEKMTVDQFIKNCDERNKVLEKLLEQNKVAERRIYSINLATYLHSKGYEYEVKRDKNDKEGICYFVFAEEIGEEIIQYKYNKEIQSFISSYRDVKEKIYEKREEVQQW